jgi:hypothetical protein
MRKALFTLTLLSSALTLPLTAHADTIDDFILTGAGNTISFPTLGDVVFGTYFPRGHELLSTSDNDIVNGTPGLGDLTFFNAPPAPFNLIVGASGLNNEPTGLFLTGPIPLDTFMSGPNPLTPGLYHLTDSHGAPYLLTVGPETTPSVPEPSTLLLFATGALGLLYLGRMSRLRGNPAMRKALFTLALLAPAFTLPLTAHADTIDQFTFNFPTTSTFIPVHLTIDLPASPPPSPYTGINGCAVDCFAVVGETASNPNPYVFYFIQFAPGSTLVEFATFNPIFGPPSAPGAYTKIFASEDLFTGSLSSPTFIPGTFDAQYMAVVGFPDFPGTITIDPVGTTVPEPSSLLLFATGALGLIAFAARRRMAPTSGAPFIALLR